jgi:hypothetical protein
MQIGEELNQPGRVVLVEEQPHAGDRDQFVLAVSREGQTGADVVPGEAWEIGQDLRFRHPGSEVFEHVGDGDSKSPECTACRRAFLARW